MTSIQVDRLTAAEAAKYLRIGRSTLAKWRMAGLGPPYHRCGLRLIQYFRHEIDVWLAACDRADRPTSVKAR
jgi:predicted DNA-binding transcriptional regulator AlpA